MWLQNLQELKKQSGKTTKQLAIVTNLPERTLTRIFTGETEHPQIDTLYMIVTALGGNLNDIFADTNVVVATESLVEVKETLEEIKGTANVIEAERDITKIENERLKVENANLKTELQLLKQELQHKDELLELHKFYRKLIPNN